MRFLFSFLILLAASPVQAAFDYMSALNIPAAHEITRGSDSMVIAVLNTGVNYELPEFRGRVVRDTDGTYGYDAFTDRKDGMDLMDFGLGTKVASQMVGNTYGIAPGAKILPVRVFDSNGSSSYEVITKGIRYALQRGARIIQFGGGPLANLPPETCETIQATAAHGVLFVVPAGNDGRELAEYPIGCASPNILVTASSDENGMLSKFSNFGFPAIHVAAPGENLSALGRDGQVTDQNSGGSFSAALGAGVAALVWSAHPEYTAQDVRTAMVRGSVHSAGLAGKVLGNGYINALGALTADIHSVQ